MSVENVGGKRYSADHTAKKRATAPAIVTDNAED